MWKKTEDQPPQAHSPAPVASPRSVDRRQEAATIGASIRIKGDLTGEEDLVIDGTLEGEVSLKEHNVTVGKSGRVKADIFGKTIRVDGEIQGNLHGAEEVVIRASGRVRGNIVSPRVTLENGSKFKGAIDMEPASRESKAKPAAPSEPAKDSPRGASAEGASRTPLKPSASGG